MTTVFIRIAALTLATSLLGACASVALELVGKAAGAALEAVGVKTPDVAAADVPKVPRKINIQFHPADNLNAGSTGQPLALVARVYQLRDPNAFLQAPYETFAAPPKEQDGLDAAGTAREVQLVPGRRVESVESVPRDVPYVGVVALFRSPAPNRWHYVFQADQAEKEGIVIGAHACALSVTRGAVYESPVADPTSLAGLRCK